MGGVRKEKQKEESQGCTGTFWTKRLYTGVADLSIRESLGNVPLLDCSGGFQSLHTGPMYQSKYSNMFYLSYANYINWFLSLKFKTQDLFIFMRAFITLALYLETGCH